MDLEACLPDAIRARTPSLTKIAAGMSGAAVYRVDTDGAAYVLRRAGPHVDPITWRRQLAIEKRAADALVAPAVVHVDEQRRAIVSAFVSGPPFPALAANPATRDRAIAGVAHALRTLHALPIDDAKPPATRALVANAWTAVRARVPAFADDIVQRALEAPPLDDGLAPVLSHNDPNPSNLVWDGARVLLLDWDTAGPAHPFYDLAVVALFVRLDDTATRALLSTYSGTPVDDVPAAFRLQRSLAGALCGAMLVSGASAAVDAHATLASTPSLGEFYARLRTGSIDLATPAGRVLFGLALLKESA